MKKCLLLVLILISFPCFSGNWYVVGDGKSEAKLNTKLIEENLWLFLSSSSKEKFHEKNSYIFQFKYISKSEIHINAMCQSIEPSSDIGTLPRLNSEQLKKVFIPIMDGGTCNFQINYNPEKEVFSKLFVNGVA